MGSGTMSIWGKGETKKIMKWVNSVGEPADGGWIIRPPLIQYEGFIPYNHGDSQIYIEYKRNIINFESSIWDDIGKAYTNILIQELAKKYELKNAGWDSVGYCLDYVLKSKGLLIEVLIGKVGLEGELEWSNKVNKILRAKAIELVED